MPREMCINLFLSAHNVKMQAYCVTNKASVGCWQSRQREHGAARRHRHQDLNAAYCSRRGCCCRWTCAGKPFTPWTLYIWSLSSSVFFLLLHSFGLICRLAWWERRLINLFYCLLRKPDVGGGAVGVSSKVKMEPRPRRRRRRAGLESPCIAHITEVVEDCSLISPIFLK